MREGTRMQEFTLRAEAKDAKIATAAYAAMKETGQRFGVEISAALFDPPLPPIAPTPPSSGAAASTPPDAIDHLPGESEEDYSHRMDRLREARQNAEKDRSLATAEPPTAKFGRVFGG